MSFIKVNNINTYYQIQGDKPQVVILLHGWGQNSEMMIHIENHLAAFFTVYNLDIVGFGQSSMMDKTYEMDDYVSWLKAFADTLKINNPIIIGHSFGCHLALRFASKYPVYKMVLTGAAGLKPKRGLDYYFKVYTYKLGRQLFKLPIINKYQKQFMNNRGSSDYQNASGYLKSSFVRVVNSYVDDLLDSINCPVLLVYGSDDQDTPLWMGQHLEKKIKDAGLVVFENQGHYAYYIQSQRFNIVLDAFFKGDQ